MRSFVRSLPATTFFCLSPLFLNAAVLPTKSKTLQAAKLDPSPAPEKRSSSDDRVCNGKQRKANPSSSRRNQAAATRFSTVEENLQPVAISLLHPTIRSSLSIGRILSSSSVETAGRPAPQQHRRSPLLEVSPLPTLPCVGTEHIASMKDFLLHKDLLAPLFGSLESLPISMFDSCVYDMITDSDVIRQALGHR
ncbi:unnamed protein product [Linum trigynum]|uniref:Uncharacterized protein n=1 Tax=Linum trigynum TaxID=586398 RepID=A0AAV2GBS8_9ROSI